MAAKKAGDVGDRTEEGMVDGADEATLECKGIETIREGISSDRYERQGIVSRWATTERVSGVHRDQ